MRKARWGKGKGSANGSHPRTGLRLSPQGALKRLTIVPTAGPAWRHRPWYPGRARPWLPRLGAAAWVSGTVALTLDFGCGRGPAGTCWSCTWVFTTPGPSAPLRGRGSRSHPRLPPRPGSRFELPLHAPAPTQWPHTCQGPARGVPRKRGPAGAPPQLLRALPPPRFGLLSKSDLTLMNRSNGLSG